MRPVLRALVGEGSQILFQAVEFRTALHHAILKAILRIALTIKERRSGDRLGAKPEVRDLKRGLPLSADIGHSPKRV